VIPERHQEYILVFRVLSLRGEAPSGRNARDATGKGEAPEQGVIAPPCKSHLYAPAWFDPSRSSLAGPDTDLRLEFVHGYRCASVHRGANGVSIPVDNLNNCFWLSKTKICYPAAALVVTMSLDSNTQEFFTGHSSSVTCLSLHPLREVAASGQEAVVGDLSPSIMIWEVSSKNVLVTLKGKHVRKITALDFSPDGRFLVSIGGDEMHMVAVYDWQRSSAPVFFDNGHLEDIAMIRHNFLRQPSGSAFDMEFCQVGRKHIKVWGYDARGKNDRGKIMTLRQSKGLLEGQKQCEPQTVFSCVFNDKDEAVVGVEQGHILFYQRNPKGGNREIGYRIDSAHNGPVLCLCFCEAGLVSGGRDGMVKIWEEGSRAEGSRSRGSGRVGGGGSRQGTRGELRHSTRRKYDIRGLASDGMQQMCAPTTIDYHEKVLLVGTSVGMIVTIDLKPGPDKEPASAIRCIVMSHTLNCGGLVTSPTGSDYFLTASEDCTLKRWSVSSKSLLQSANVGIKAICVALSPDESLAAIGHARGRFTVWDLGHPEMHKRDPRNAPFPRCLLKNTFRHEDVTDVKFSLDGRYLAVATREQVIDVYQVHYDFNRVGVCKGHTAAVLHIDFSVDSKYLRSSCAAAEILYWEMPSCKQRGRGRDLKDVSWATYSVTFDWALQGFWHAGMLSGSIDSMDVANSMGTVVAGMDSGKLRLMKYPALQGGKFKEFGGASTHVLTIKFTLDDERVIATCADGTVLVYRHATRRDLDRPVQRAEVRRFHPDGGLTREAIIRPVHQGTFANEHSRRNG
jgi:WD40 repeat protein